MHKAKKVRYDHLNFRLAEWDEEEKIITFINDNFDWKLPLVNHRAFFEYYYCGKRLQFTLAEQDGTLVAVAGYILANDSETPDLWVSVWVALKGAMGAGLELMDAIPRLTNARVVACNNIRENTCAFYRFLGWTAERLPHYYRLSKAASMGAYQLYRPAVQNLNQPNAPQASLAKQRDATAYQCEQSATNHADCQLQSQLPRLAVSGDLTLTRVENAAMLQALGLPILQTPAQPSTDLQHTTAPQTPAKDFAYLQRRYFEYPYLQYDVWSVQQNDTLLAYCVTRTVQSYAEQDAASDANTATLTSATTVQRQSNNDTTQATIPVVRIVDFIGDTTILPRIGQALDDLLEAEHAEYMDCYCAGIAPDLFAAAGFFERTADGCEIVPNYLTPILAANTEYFYFTNNPTGFTLFKADGDQDRPNLP